MTSLSLESILQIEKGTEGLPAGPWRAHDHNSMARFGNDPADWIGYAWVGAGGKPNGNFDAKIADLDARKDGNIEYRKTKAPLAAHIARLSPEVVSELCRLAKIGLAVEAEAESNPRDDDVAAASIVYQCADCLQAEADYSCHPVDRVVVIGSEVICLDCADAGHQGEPRRKLPDIAKKIKRQRMHIAHLSRALPTSDGATT
jgi:hypothetical protein